MASIGKIKSPYGGLCLACGWRKHPALCIDRLIVYSDASAGTAIIALNFAGRGKVSAAGYCGGSDIYITPWAEVPEVDVWKAYDDGIWTSSVTIDVYMATTSFSGRIYGQPKFSIADRVTSPAKSYTNLSCAASPIISTITVFDDGSFTVS